MENNYLKEYLDFYKNEKSPGYAVLITGEWGSGKTYQIKKLLDKEEMHYVSLFGIKNQADIYASVYAKMHPIKGLAKEATQKVSETTLEAGGFSLGVVGLIGGLANAFIKETVENDKIIVFDDLERCLLKPNEILGAINKYVDQNDCKVIAIAHDNKLAAIFHSTKEKVFGHTIRVESNIDAVFDSFIEKLENSTFLRQIKSIILRSFENSGSKSLRILKHTINDCERLISCINNQYKHNNSAMSELFSLFTSLSIEIRIGEIKEKDLMDRDEAYNIKLRAAFGMNNKNKDEKNKTPLHPINELSEKHKEIKLNSDLLNTQELINTLIKGYYNSEKINKCISMSNYFSTQKEQPIWLQLMSFDDLEDEIVDSLIIKFNTEFSKRELKEYGELIHIFCLRFLMSFKNIIPDNFEQVFTDCKTYIDELLKNGLLPAKGPNNYNMMIRSDSYGGHGFWIENEYYEYIQNIKNYLTEQMSESLKNKYPEFNKEILDALKNDGDNFRKLVCVSYEGAGKYSNMDLLPSIPAEEFVNAWLSSKHSNWQVIALSLKLRYDAGQLENDLKSEKPWFSQVKNELTLRADELSGFQKYRIERLIMTAYR